MRWEMRGMIAVDESVGGSRRSHGIVDWRVRGQFGRVGRIVRVFHTSMGEEA